MKNVLLLLLVLSGIGVYFCPYIVAVSIVLGLIILVELYLDKTTFTIKKIQEIHNRLIDMDKKLIDLDDRVNKVSFKAR